MTINKFAVAKWTGTIKEGQGFVSLESGAFIDQPYGFNHRFEGETGTNPEELIAAAHASCFTMALSMILEQHDIDPTKHELHTKATVSLDKDGEGFKVSKSHLEFIAKLDDADEDAFREALDKAKAGCPISKVLDCEITLDIKFK